MCEHEDSLRDEVRQHFRDEARRYFRQGKKTPNIIPSDRDDHRKRYTECDELWDDSQVKVKPKAKK